MAIVLRIKHKDWETFATASITGMWASANIEAGNKEFDKELIIEVEQTTMGYKRQHGGPHEMIVPEHTPWLLMEDVASLITQHGVNITFKEIPVLEPEED